MVAVIFDSGEVTIKALLAKRPIGRLGIHHFPATEHLN
jgi:hypothetical protein